VEASAPAEGPSSACESATDARCPIVEAFEKAKWWDEEHAMNDATVKGSERGDRR